MTKSRRKLPQSPSNSSAAQPVVPAAPPAAAFEYLESPSDGGDWVGACLRVLVRRRLPASLVFVVVVLGVVAYIVQTPPVFEARSQLLIQVETPEPIRFRDALDRDQLTTDDYQTQYSILKSRSLVRRTLDSLQLWDAAEFAPGQPGWFSAAPAEPQAGPAPSGRQAAEAPPAPEGASGLPLGTGSPGSLSPNPAPSAAPASGTPAAGASARSRRREAAPADRNAEVSPLPAPRPDVAAPETVTATAGAPPVAETAQQTKVIDNFIKQLSVEPVVNSRLVDVMFRSKDPELAARVANTLARVYIDQNVESRFESARTAASWLEEQLNEQRERVEKGQQNLQRYRERNPGTGVENTQNVVAQKVADLNSALTRAETNRIEKESAFERLRAARDNPQALEAFPAILGNVFIQELKTELAGLQRRRQDQSQLLGQRHPEMLKLAASISTAETRLRSEVDKVVQAVENEYLAARAQEDRLRVELTGQQQAATAQDRRSVNYGVLEREVASSQQLFDSLLQRAKEIGVAGEFRSTNVRVVDEAEVPQTPVWPPKLPALLFALLAGSGLALCAAFGLERLDPRIKSPADIPTELGLPFLGLVPEIDTATAATVSTMAGASPMVVGAFEELAKNVLNMVSPGTPRVLMVCSAGIGEGKSLVAANLAAAIADARQRVLLIDADLRRPRAHDLCDVHRTPGLSELLGGRAVVAEAVKSSKVVDLAVLPAGHSVGKTAAFFGDGQQFTAILSSLVASESYDWIVIDSPPVLVVADGALIAREATGVVFVVSASDTKREAARLAIDRLDASGATFFGIVFNRANIESHGYYFAPYYRPEYSAYYGQQPGAVVEGPVNRRADRVSTAPPSESAAALPIAGEAPAGPGTETTAISPAAVTVGRGKRHRSREMARRAARSLATAADTTPTAGVQATAADHAPLVAPPADALPLDPPLAPTRAEASTADSQ